MSTGSTPPGGTPPGTPPPPPGATPPPPGGIGPEEEGTRLSLGAVIAIAVAVLAIAGVGGYLIGHSKGESSGDAMGYSDGLAAGKKQVQANYQEGKPGYEKIYAAGKSAGEEEGKKAGEEEGKKVGFQEGERQGVSTGQSEGVKQGSAAVLGGFDSWTDGAYYIVTMSSGSDVPYTISSRTQIQPATNYRLCSNGGSQQLCQSPVTDGGGGGDNGGADE